MIGLVALLASSAPAALFGTLLRDPARQSTACWKTAASSSGRGRGLTACIYIIGALSTLGYTQLMVCAPRKSIARDPPDLFAHLQTQPLRHFDTYQR